MPPRLIEIRKRLLEIKKRKMELRSEAANADDKKVNEIADEAAKLDKEELDLEEEKDTLEKRSALLSQLSSGQGAGSAIEIPDNGGAEQRNYGLDSEEYRSAFFKRLAGVELNEVEQRAMNTNANSAGVTVPTQTLNKIYEKLEKDAIAYELVTVSHLKGQVVIPYEGITHDAERKGENEKGTIVDDTIDALRLGAKKYIKLVELTCELENTAIDALEDFVVNRLAKKIMLAVDYDIINGSGIKSAKGILNSITPIETEDVGKISYKDLTKLFAKLKAHAKKNATLMMSTNTLWLDVYGITDANEKPIFDPTIGRIFGYKPIENDDVPDGTIIFGDFSEYMFNWTKDIELSRSNEAQFESGNTVFRGLALGDGGLLDLGAMVAMKYKTTSGGASGQGQ